ncbi:hypothetical protein NMG29_07100 [Streptomyces cocklensis]|jgi:hypothetical protein|uniref:Uncharacterized protein n=1 Tax=Actinacidiphila cocklensis TaxID=887465 RepID=A0A9W4GQ38_9ACTN|nr:hypothetical protein [Actinacidiphila cocklensis]MDD1057995.1 hypothetical protein [Actinacidiphila cocklensis]WSX79558.1 hypothetical protein OH826_40365 [Streptomyces sp. NBC_00899]CAG6393013.1 conserved hypothetical protein [Actinacidiphila cocklensis]
MSSVRIQSLDGGTLIPAERVTALDVVGGTLVAQVPSMGGPFVLAEGTPHELSDAAHALMPGITALGEGDHVVRATRSSTGIGWDATTHDETGEESGGAGWAAASQAQPDLKSRYDRR